MFEDYHKLIDVATALNDYFSSKRPLWCQGSSATPWAKDFSVDAWGDLPKLLKERIESPKLEDEAWMKLTQDMYGQLQRYVYCWIDEIEFDTFQFRYKLNNIKNVKPWDVPESQRGLTVNSKRIEYWKELQPKSKKRKLNFE